MTAPFPLTSVEDVFLAFFKIAQLLPPSLPASLLFLWDLVFFCGSLFQWELSVLWQTLLPPSFPADRPTATEVENQTDSILPHRRNPTTGQLSFPSFLPTPMKSGEVDSGVADAEKGGLDEDGGDAF